MDLRLGCPQLGFERGEVGHAPGTKVLYMSGYTENAIVHHGRLDEDAELLQRPFRQADLVRAVRSAIDSRSE